MESPPNSKKLERVPTVSVTKEGIFFVNGKQVEEKELVGQLTYLKDKIEKHHVVVRADEATKSREIMKIMRAAKAAEYEKLIVAGEPLSKKEQKQLEQDEIEHQQASSETE